MTIKEALEYLDTIPTIGEQVDALEMAVKSLEAWSGLREEIVNIKNNPLFGMVSKETLHEVALEIIDKHLAELELQDE